MLVFLGQQDNSYHAKQNAISLIAASPGLTQYLPGGELWLSDVLMGLSSCQVVKLSSCRVIGLSGYRVVGLSGCKSHLLNTLLRLVIPGKDSTFTPLFPNSLKIYYKVSLLCLLW